MQAEFRQEVSPQAAAALIAHLRQHPENARRSAGDLARQFDLSEPFVRSVLEGLEPREMEANVFRSPRISFTYLALLWSAIVRLFDRLTQRPTRFVLGTTVACVAFTTVFTMFPHIGKITFSPYKITIEDSVVSLAIVATFASHMACFFHRRMARYALYGALVVWMVTAIISMVGVWMSLNGKPEIERFTTVMATGIGMFFISLFYAGAGTLASVGGGWLGMKMQEREQERMSRQDLLERYFELQSRLQSGAVHPALKMPWADLSPVLRFQRHPFAWSMALGLLISATQTLLVGTLQLDGPDLYQSGSAISIVKMFLLVTISLANFLAYVAVGFFSGRVGKAILCSILYSVGGIVPTLIPIGNFGPNYLLNSTHLAQQGIAIPIFGVVSAVAAVGAIVQTRGLREKSLQSNDQATIIAEMLRIQWRLANHVSNVCVMVVDAAKSSVMKAEADPLAVEYSFREYQEWLEAIGRQFGGRVHSTAGDGAVISFENCEDALEAGRLIQGDLPRFNQEVNRLKSPFRLRIGLHRGQIAGDIDEVQFSEVIDIAAHVQDVSPIAGIAMTDDVAASLPQEQVIPLAVEVDGHKVFLVMQPTI